MTAYKHMHVEVRFVVEQDEAWGSPDEREITRYTLEKAIVNYLELFGQLPHPLPALPGMEEEVDAEKYVVTYERSFLTILDQDEHPWCICDINIAANLIRFNLNSAI